MSSSCYTYLFLPFCPPHPGRPCPFFPPRDIFQLYLAYILIVRLHFYPSPYHNCDIYCYYQYLLLCSILSLPSVAFLKGVWAFWWAASSAKSTLPVSISFAFSCGLSLDLTSNVKWKKNWWSKMFSQRNFSGMLHSRSPKFSFTYLGLRGNHCRSSQPWQSPRKGKNTGREQLWHVPSWPPKRSAARYCEIWCKRSVSKPLLPFSPLHSLSSSVSSVLPNLYI